MDSDKKFVDFDSVFATRLRSLMESNKTTQKELAEIVGTTRQAISQYADGSVQPNVEKLYKMASYFKVSSDWLIGMNDIKSPDVDDVAINKRLGLTQEAIEHLTFLNENFDFDPPIGNNLNMINFLLSNDNINSDFLLSKIAEYFYGVKALEICTNAHYHVDNMVSIDSNGKETEMGSYIIKDFLREQDVLNIQLIDIQKSLVKAMEHIRKFEPDPNPARNMFFGSYKIEKDGEENGGEA